jgi:hypothetical protein
MAETKKASLPSPGNDLYPDIPPMRAPHMDFVYRMVAEMHPTQIYKMKNVQGTNITRQVMHIAGGTVRGPRINGTLVKDSGADWAQRMDSPKVCTGLSQCRKGKDLLLMIIVKEFFRLDARYAMQTDDGYYIYIRSRGIFTPGPNKTPADQAAAREEEKMSQDDVEYFTNLTFEADGDGPYNWMNEIFCVGTLQGVDGKVVIDAWRLTNFPGVDVTAKL